MIAVAASGLYRRYGRRFALVDVSFEVPRAACVMLAGRNGSGKSTLLRVVSTLLRPDRGQLKLLGHDARTESELVRRRTALLGHRTFFYEPLTALENLALWARLLDRDASPAALAERLAEVGLAERAQDPVSGFSAGMRQRLALARVLVKDAEVVLLDEPYGHLDPPGFRLVDGLLERLRGRGRTVLMATHLLARGKEQCDRALLLEAGRVTFSGPASEVRDGAFDAGSAEGAP